MKKTVILITICIMASITSFAQCPKPHRAIYFSFPNDKYELIKDIMDKGSFQKISRNYYKDKNHVYYNYIVDVGSAHSSIIETFHLIEDADPQTFKVLEKILIYGEFEVYPFACDKSRVYYEGFPIENANPKTFRSLNDTYSTDGKRIFFKNCEIENADLQTFKVSGDGYYAFAYDKHFLYFHYQKEKIDIETFEIEHNSSTRCSDKRYVFYLIGTGFDGHIEKKRKLFNLKICCFFSQKIIVLL